MAPTISTCRVTVVSMASMHAYFLLLLAKPHFLSLLHVHCFKVTSAGPLSRLQYRHIIYLRSLSTHSATRTVAKHTIQVMSLPKLVAFAAGKMLLLEVPKNRPETREIRNHFDLNLIQCFSIRTPATAASTWALQLNQNRPCHFHILGTDSPESIPISRHAKLDLRLVTWRGAFIQTLSRTLCRII